MATASNKPALAPELLASNLVPVVQMAAIARRFAGIAASFAPERTAYVEGELPTAISVDPTREAQRAIANAMLRHAEQAVTDWPPFTVSKTGLAPDVIAALDKLLDLSQCVYRNGDSRGTIAGKQLLATAIRKVTVTD